MADAKKFIITFLIIIYFAFCSINTCLVTKMCYFQTNTFQMVLATDEVFTYAIFNYADIQWTSHTEAGGDTTGGEGGTPAFVSIIKLPVNRIFCYTKCAECI